MGDTETAYSEEAGQVFSTIFHKYNQRVPPIKLYPNPVEVTIHLTLIQIHDLDIEQQELDSTVDLEASWVDRRLFWYPFKVNKISVNRTTIWTPDLQFLNAMSAPQITLDPDLSVVSSGDIYWYRRMRVKTSCSTNLYTYDQNCSLVLGSNLYTTIEQTIKNISTFSVSPGLKSHKWNITDVSSDVNDQKHPTLMPLFMQNNTIFTADLSLDLREELKEKAIAEAQAALEPTNIAIRTEISVISFLLLQFILLSR